MDAKNIASERGAVKCGYQKEGVSRAANFVQGKYVDMNIYALLRHEWEQILNSDLDEEARVLYGQACPCKCRLERRKKENLC